MEKFLDCIVITGAGKGLGKAIALELKNIGIPLLLISQSNNVVQTVKEINQSIGQTEFMIQDVSDLDQTYSRIRDWSDQSSFNRFGVVLCAGILGEPGGIINGELSDWLQTYKVNVLGNLAVLKALMPRMLKASFGRIVAVAGGGAAYGYPLFSGYALSKTSLVREVENIHLELKDKGDFFITALAPGAMETDMLQQIRATGAEIRTVVDIKEPVNFVSSFLFSTHCAFSGRFVHVRDNWKEKLESSADMSSTDNWFLRRIEK